MKVIAPLSTLAAPAPQLPAIQTGSRQVGANHFPPGTDGLLKGPDITLQARQVLEGCETAFAMAGARLRDAGMADAYLADLDFAPMNTIHVGAFGGRRPARPTVQVAKLPCEARMQNNAIAVPV